MQSVDRGGFVLLLYLFRRFKNFAVFSEILKTGNIIIVVKLIVTILHDRAVFKNTHKRCHTYKCLDAVPITHRI